MGTALADHDDNRQLMTVCPILWAKPATYGVTPGCHTQPTEHKMTYWPPYCSDCPHLKFYATSAGVCTKCTHIYSQHSHSDPALYHNNGSADTKHADHAPIFMQLHHQTTHTAAYHNNTAHAQFTMQKMSAQTKCTPFAATSISYCECQSIHRTNSH